MRKFLILLLLPLLLIVGTGASAAPAEATEVAVVTEVENPGDTESTEEGRDNAYRASEYLPIHRWGDAMGLHSRLNWFNPAQAAVSVGSRQQAASNLGLGNALWGWASDWTYSATTFDVLRGQFGFQVDRFSGAFGNALKANPFLFGLAGAFLAVTVLWRGWRSGGRVRWGKFGGAVIVVALIGFMSTQAAASTSGSLAPYAKYNPAQGSPVWVATTLTDAIDDTAGVLVAPMLEVTRSVTESGEAADKWSCDALGKAALSLAAAGGPSAGARSVMTTMNTLWMSTALPNYTSVQFGGMNEFGKNAACHQLERQADVTGDSKRELLGKAFNGADETKRLDVLGLGITSKYGPLMKSTGDNEVNDMVLVGLAACTPLGGGEFSVHSDWAEYSGDAAEVDDAKSEGPWITPENCAALFAAKKSDDVRSIDADRAGDTGGGIAGIGAEKKGIFNVEGQYEDAVKLTKKPQVLAYLSAIHGSDNGVAMLGVATSVTFVAGAVISAGIFLVLSLAVMGAKLVMLLLVAVLFFLLLLALFRSDGLGTMAGPGRQLLSTALFAFAASLILSVIGMFSMLIAGFGAAFGGEGSLGATMWAAFSPVLAVVALHLIFKRVLKVPSPVTLRGAMAWGTAGGAVAGAVAGGVASRLGRSAKSVARAGAGAAWKGTKSLAGFAPKAAAGAGDAGPRRTETSKTKENASDTPLAQKSEQAPKTAPEKDREAVREARRMWREENPGALRRGREALRQMTQPIRNRNENRLAAYNRLQATGALDGNRGAKDVAAGILRDASAPGAGNYDMSGFLTPPGEEHKPLQRVPVESWSDLSKDDKRIATQAARGYARTDYRKALADADGFRGRMGVRMNQPAVRRTVGAAKVVGAVGVATTGLAIPAAAVFAASKGVKAARAAKVRRGERKEYIANKLNERAQTEEKTE